MPEAVLVAPGDPIGRAVKGRWSNAAPTTSAPSSKDGLAKGAATERATWRTCSSLRPTAR